MARYRVEVYEIQKVLSIYTVEADSVEEAEEKAERGDSLEEEEGECLGVQERTVATPAELEED